jgi:transcriptional regulator NrdR family protein
MEEQSKEQIFEEVIKLIIKRQNSRNGSERSELMKQIIQKMAKHKISTDDVQKYMKQKNERQKNSNGYER